MQSTQVQSQPRIIRAHEAITVQHPIFLIFGEPGICKSSLGYSAKNPLLLDADKGAHRAANRRDTWPVSCWGDITALYEQPDILEPFGAIVPDTIGRILDYITLDIAENDPKKAPGGSLSQQGWGVLKSRFAQWMNRTRAMGKDVLLIAHHKEERDGDQRIMRPDIQGGSLHEVLKIADYVGYLYMSGKDRMLDFNPTDRWTGKNPAQWKPFKVPPVGKAATFMAELMDQGREALGKISEASALIARQVDEWCLQIATFQSAHEFNRALPELQKLTAAAAPQVKAVLIARANELSLTVDPVTRTFVDPKPAAKQPELAGSFI
jgi:AAA domain